ncbi:MAG: 50S ribosomal protein L32 [Planctomycetota bacterium]
MLPVQRKTHSQTRKGRANKSINPTHSVTCPECGSPKLPHAACAECGYVRPGLKLSIGRDDD